MTLNEIKRLGAKKAVIIGGVGSITKEVEVQLQKEGIQTRRIGGKDRFEVSSKIANELNQWEKVIVTNGLGFADALAISPYASVNGYPILLVKNKEIPAVIQQQIKSHTIKQAEIIGGIGSVDQNIAAQLPNPSRIGGADRYEVAKNIYQTHFGNNEPIYVVSGLNFADALTGSILISKNNGALLLTRPTTLPDSIKPIIQSYPFTILGGEGSVRNDIFVK